MLNRINCSEDVKKIEYSALPKLTDEIRDEILKVVSENGGHLASNLGMVELTVALHRVFDFPKDKLIFDVGHQCYAHKLLTGRKDSFSTIRKKDGLSGFTNRFESEYDTLTAGHSGPSVSAGLGIAAANKLAGNDSYVVSVVGDGSFTNGMIYEALNNCCDKSLKYIIVLNDNEMSISSNVGNLSKHFSKLRTSKRYFKFKHKLKSFCMRVPVIGKALVSFFSGTKKFFKKVLLQNDGFLSALDIRYLGPVDGHNIEKLEDVFNEAKSLNECCFVLVKTQKGLGYKKAELEPENYHSVGKFSLEDGVVKSTKKTFSDVFGEIVTARADKDNKVVALTAAMCEGTGLLDFSKKYPQRFFDVGIAEEHEIAFAGGLAAGGMKPVCAVYSTFAQRVYDEVFHDLSVQKLPCVIALDRSGFVPDDGVTHQGLFDVSLFSSIPDCSIYSPETYSEMEMCFNKAFDGQGVSVVRYPKGSMSEYDRSAFEYINNEAFAVCGDINAEISIVTYGRITEQAYGAYLQLKDRHTVKIIKLVSIYPVDYETVSKLISSSKLVYILEEGIKSGGIAEKISCNLNADFSGKIIINAVDNEFAFHAKTEELFEHFGMTSVQICREIENVF